MKSNSLNYKTDKNQMVINSDHFRYVIRITYTALS